MEHISKCLRTLFAEGFKARKEVQCKVCGIRKADGVDSFEVCGKCRPQFERDYDAWIDAQIEAKLLEEAEGGE